MQKAVAAQKAKEVNEAEEEEDLDVSESEEVLLSQKRPAKELPRKEKRQKKDREKKKTAAVTNPTQIGENLGLTHQDVQAVKARLYVQMCALGKSLPRTYNFISVTYDFLQSRTLKRV